MQLVTFLKNSSYAPLRNTWFRCGSPTDIS